MTACTNHGGKARRVVTAALVGVLSVGTVPMAALAEGVSDGIEVLTADETTSFENSDVTVNGLTNGSKVDYVTASEGGTELKVTKIVAGNGQPYDLTQASVARQFRVDIVKVGADGAPTDDVVTAKEATTTPGTYAMKITALGYEFQGAVCYKQFVVKPAQLIASQLSVYEVNPANPTSTADNNFVFTGSELDLGIAYNGAVLTEGVDYEVKFIADTTGTGNEGVAVKDAGEYHAVINGLGIYAGQNEIAVPGTIHVYRFNLADPEVTISCDPVIASNVFPGHPTTVVYAHQVNGVMTYTYLDPSLVDLTITKGGTDDSVFDKPGQYTVECTPAEAAGKNVYVSSGATVTTTINKYLDRASIEYDKKPIEDAYTVDLSASRDQAFNLWSVAAYDAEDNQITGKGCVVVTVYDESGAPVATFDSSDGGYAAGSKTNWSYVPGTYTVKVVAGINSDTDTDGTIDRSAAAVATCTVKVISGTIDADATAYVNYDVDGKGDWEAVTSIKRAYDATGIKVGPSDAADANVQVVVKDDEGKELTYDTDYAVKVLDADGNELKADRDGCYSFADAGSYTIEIVGKAYDVTGSTTVPVTIEKASLEGVLDLEKTGFKAESSNYEYLPWREGGSVATDFVKSGVLDLFDATITKDGAEVNKVTDEGVYKVSFAPLSDEVAANYETPETIEFECIKDASEGTLSHLLFTDVRYTDYFADSVARVKSKGYMNGYNNGSLFGSMDSLKRGDVACILYNMAVADGRVFPGWDEGTYVEGFGYKSFDDVDGNMYYAKAIAWGKSAGVTNGSNGLFRPEDTVTREEFAAMLANYASKFDPSFELVDTDAVLATKPDGSQVSDWAKDVIAWAVENDVIGNGGSIMPGKTITRADAACVVSNYIFGL